MSQLKSPHGINGFTNNSFYVQLSLLFLFLDAAPHAFVETLREKMFKPSLSTIVNENTKYCFFL